MPKVSIIMTVYNAELYLRESLESAIYQTLKDIEIICINDGSKDNSLKILEEYAQKDNRIKIINQKNQGPGIARNNGLDVAQGDYIMILDSDDWLVPDACEKAYNKIFATKDDMVFFDFYEATGDKGTLKNNNSKNKFLKDYINKNSFHMWEIKKPFLNGAETWYRIYDRNFLNKNNIRYPKENFGEDVVFTYHCISCANTVSIINDRLYVYRLTNSSTTTTSAKKWKETFTTRQKAYNFILNSEHSEKLLKSFLPYLINSSIYWYRRWTKQKNFDKKAYYNEMHKFFNQLNLYHSEIISEQKNYINDYKFFKHAVNENWEQRHIVKILHSILSTDNVKNHKIIRCCGIKIKIKRSNKSLQEYKKLSKYYSKHIKQIQQKVKNGEKIRVAFYVNDSKWKCQKLFELLKKHPAYEPFMLIGRNAVPTNHIEYQTDEEIKNIYNSFKSQNMPCYYAYDFEEQKHYPITNFKPDILFYSRQFCITEAYEIHNIAQHCLTCYIPYFISNSPAKIEASKPFHNLLWRYFLINGDLKEEYTSIMANKGANLSAVGYPDLETYLEESKNNKEYVIYAPHWSIGNTTLKYATFDWNGLYMLEYAKAHPEIKWVFKPHPILKGRLVEYGLMTEEEADNYYAEWEKIGIKYEGPDYFDLFKQSKCLITDCGSFLAEYMPTKNPVILLRSKNATPYNFLAQKVTKYYYSTWNLEELEHNLKMVIEQNRDPWKERRLAMLDSLKLVNNASQNILDEFNKIFSIT